MTAPDYEAMAIAAGAVDLLCRLGYLGLDRSRQRELWQMVVVADIAPGGRQMICAECSEEICPGCFECGCDGPCGCDCGMNPLFRG